MKVPTFLPGTGYGSVEPLLGKQKKNKKTAIFASVFAGLVAGCFILAVQNITSPSTSGTSTNLAAYPEPETDVMAFGGSATCEKAGNACTKDDECCSAYCFIKSNGEGMCKDPGSGCDLAVGDSCSSSYPCCSGNCDQIAQVCTECLSNGESCNKNYNCCSGFCYERGDESNDEGAEGVCKDFGATCTLSDGESCQRSDECCSGNCNQNESKCGGCISNGITCTEDRQCCGGECFTETNGEQICKTAQSTFAPSPLSTFAPSPLPLYH